LRGYPTLPDEANGAGDGSQGAPGVRRVRANPSPAGKQEQLLPRRTLGDQGLGGEGAHGLVLVQGGLLGEAGHAFRKADS